MASNKLQKKDYTRASLRAYFLQNGMNYSNYQGLGYANMLYPGLRKIYAAFCRIEVVCKTPQLLCRYFGT